MAQSKYFPNLENGVDNANVEQVEQAFSDIETDINNILNTKQDTLTFDDTPTAGSLNPVTSGGVKTVLDEKVNKKENYGLIKGSIYSVGVGKGMSLYFENGTDFGTIFDYDAITNLLQKKQDMLTFDDTPTADSTNPVTSGGVKTELDKKADKADLTDYLKITDINSAVRSVRPDVKNTIDTISVNTIYDLGIQTALTITLPSGRVGDFIEFDFFSGETATNLTINSSSGLVGFDLIPGTNTVYTLYFDWGVTGHDGTSITYGWRCNYSEYSITV